MKLVKNRKNKNKSVYYANELARINNKFTIEEEKVLHLIFSQIKPFHKNPTKFKIEKKLFFEKLNIVGDDKYKRYEITFRKLINKTLTEIYQKDTNSKLMGVVIIDTNWFYKKSYFEVSLNPNFMPYLEQLVKNYTVVNLDNVLSLDSKHALTLYKFLCSWTDDSKNQNKRYITTKELKELFGLSIDDYVYNGKFRRDNFEKYTIDTALKEINNKTNMNVSVKKNKKNNKVLNYEFKWKQKQTTKTINTKKQITIDDLEKENNLKVVKQDKKNAAAIKPKKTTAQSLIKKMLTEIDNDNNLVNLK